MSTARDDANPFRPPSAPLEVTRDLAEVPFFTASGTKFVVMSLGTFSGYMLYWFYRNFRAIRDRTGRSIMPFWRTVFSIIWAYGCFRDIALLSGRSRMAAAGLAVPFIAFSLLAQAPDPYWLVSFGSIAPTFVANRWAEQANERAQPGHPRNHRFTGLNIFWLALGILFTLLVVTALLRAPGSR